MDLDTALADAAPSTPPDVAPDAAPDAPKPSISFTPDQVALLGAGVGDTVTLKITGAGEGDEEGLTAEVVDVLPADAGGEGELPPTEGEEDIADADESGEGAVPSDEDDAEEKMLGYKRPSKKKAPPFGASAAGLDQ